MANQRKFPTLDFESAAPTRDALHAYSRVLGDRLKAYRPKRKHWWHASLRPALTGLTTGVVHAEVDFELALDFQGSALSGQTSEGAHLYEGLDGRSMAEVAGAVDSFLADSGVDTDKIPAIDAYSSENFGGYSAGHAGSLGRVLAAVSAAMAHFRAGIMGETSPIQLWPHHFDLSMLWLPGEKIEGQDPDNEEYSDKQMNFGFTLGDEGIPEPYFYVTAYPLPDGFPSLDLPPGTHWKSDGFSGAVLLYQTLLTSGDPHSYLQDLWT
ncbi:MAG: DUF5996 family protein, partial [Woeseiaceae bacterium]